MAALCDLWDPGWGDPGFPHCALLLHSPLCMVLFVLGFLVASFLYLMAILVASSTAFVQACGRSIRLKGTSAVVEMFGRGSGRAT